MTPLPAPNANADVNEFDPVITASDREALRRGYVFDPVKADRPVRFIEQFCRQSIGEFAGQPLILLPWQRHAIWRAFGWVDADGFRRHRDLFIEVPKKSGKGELASALCLYMLVADGESVPKIVLAAVDKKQAGNTFEEAVRMVRQSPALAKRVVVSEFYKTIKCPANDGVIEVHSSEVDSKDGGNYAAVFTDELHRWTGSKRKAWNVYSGSGAARRQPLRIVTSTAGTDRNSVMYEQHTRALKIESGEIVDTTFCGTVFGPRPGEVFDPTSEETWLRFNPSLGKTRTLSGFRADFESNRHSPESFAYWRQTRLNEWHQEAARYIDREAWAACPKPRSEAEIFESGDAWYAGLDLSSTRDLTAFVRVAGNTRDGLDVYCRCWLPEDEAKRRQQEQGIPYETWAEQGYITLTPGSRIDYEAVQAAIEADFGVTNFRVLNGDWYNANNVGRSLLNKGIPFQVIRQGFLSQNAPTKELERLVATGKIRHDNPVLTWCISNAVAERDKADNVMLSKSRSHEKIDLAQALVNAIAGAMDAQVEPPKPVFDENPKVIWLKL